MPEHHLFSPIDVHQRHTIDSTKDIDYLAQYNITASVNDSKSIPYIVSHPLKTTAASSSRNYSGEHHDRSKHSIYALYSHKATNTLPSNKGTPCYKQTTNTTIMKFDCCLASNATHIPHSQKPRKPHTGIFSLFKPLKQLSHINRKAKEKTK